jgi:hypothetical protein
VKNESISSTIGAGGGLNVWNNVDVHGYWILEANISLSHDLNIRKSIFTNDFEMIVSILFNPYLLT